MRSHGECLYVLLRLKEKKPWECVVSLPVSFSIFFFCFGFPQRTSKSERQKWWGIIKKEKKQGAGSKILLLWKRKDNETTGKNGPASYPHTHYISTCVHLCPASLGTELVCVCVCGKKSEQSRRYGMGTSKRRVYSKSIGITPPCRYTYAHIPGMYIYTF